METSETSIATFVETTRRVIDQGGFAEYLPIATNTFASLSDSYAIRPNAFFKNKT